MPRPAANSASSSATPLGSRTTTSTTTNPDLEGRSVVVSLGRPDAGDPDLADQVYVVPLLGDSLGGEQVLPPRFEYRTRVLDCVFRWSGPVCARRAYHAQRELFVWSDRYRTEGVDRYPTAEAVASLGYVEAGEAIEIGLDYEIVTTDGGVALAPMEFYDFGGPVYGLSEGAVWGGQGYYSAGWYPYLGDSKDELSVYVEIVAPEVRFLRQDDTVIPTEAENRDEAVLMVSKAVTNQERSDKGIGFASPYAAGQGDPDTFRPQVTGLDPGLADELSFRVEVLRGGQSVIEDTFKVRQGTLPDGSVAYRGYKHLRLVSNDTPPGGPGFAEYDDEYADKQTVLVKLGGTVRVSVERDEGGAGNPVAVSSAELPVGRPAAENGPNAIRHAELNWHVYEDLLAVPGTITDRMSEDWAQAAVRFDLVGSRTFGQEDLDNVISLKFKDRGRFRADRKEASEPGIFSFDVAVGGTTVGVSVAYSQGDDLYTISQKAEAAMLAPLAFRFGSTQL